MTTNSVIIGNHAYFVRDGTSFTSPSAGTASRTAKPGQNDTSWIDLGIIRTTSIQHERDTIDVFAPTPGVKRLWDRHETKRVLAVNITMEEMSPLAWELLMGTLALTSASTQYNPLEGPTKKGWLKLVQYKQDDTTFNVSDLFCHLSIDGDTEFGDSVVSPVFKATLLHSTLNTGTLS